MIGNGQGKTEIPLDRYLSPKNDAPDPIDLPSANTSQLTAFENWRTLPIASYGKSAYASW
jgi:hypothetical protein